MLAIPFVGPTARKFVTAQMARTLATLLGGGIPLVNSMEVTARSVSNHHMAKELDVVTQRVREGQGLAASLTARAVVPDVALKMIEVGESTGSLQDMLSSLADFYDEEVETSVGAIRHLHRAGAAGADGAGHRGAGAGALYAVVPVEQRCESVRPAANT